MRKLTVACLFALFALVGLALVAAPAEAQNKKRGDQSKITRADLNESGGGIVTAYDAVRVLRPRWLQPPTGRQASATLGGGSRASNAVIVYVDNLRQPDVERSLSSVKAAELVEMRHLDQNRSVQEFGPGHEAGVIKVTTVRRPL